MTDMDRRGKKGFRRKRKSMNQFIKKANYRFQKDKRQTGNVFETEEYLLHVLRTNPDNFESPDEKEMYCSNVFEEISGKEVEVSCSRIGSTAMEKLLPIADKKILLRLTHLFSLDLRSLFQDKYGSHVLQHLITVVSNYVQESEDQDGESQMEGRLRSWWLQVSTYAVNNVEEFVNNLYANQVLREVLMCASRQKSHQGTETKAVKTPVDHELTSLVERCAEQMMKLPDVTDFPFDSLRSGLLQACLRALHAVNQKQGRTMAKALLNLSYPPPASVPEGDLPEVYCSKSASHLLDAIIEISSKALRVKLHNDYFQNNLKALALAQNANFCVQNFISRCTDNAQFESLFDELTVHLQAVLTRRHSGVILALAKGCERLRIRQGAFIKALGAALQCPEDAPEQLFVLLALQLLPSEAWKRRSERAEAEDLEQGSRHGLSISLHGSLIVQAMLNFNKPVKVVKSILALEQRLLEQILCDPRGSHMADAFAQGSAVGEKNRERLLLKLKGCMVRLAVSPHGGRALEALFNKASLSARHCVTEELSPNLALISQSRCGSVLIYRFALELFRRNPAQWEKAQQQGKKLLLLDELNEPAMKKKKV